jgi:flagella basal body P-ring formation protein FlgA
MIRNIAATLISLSISVAAATAAERPTLRSEAIVNDSVVRIGDLIDNAGVVANVPVFRAPALGQTGTVTATQVLEAVRSHALVGLDPGPVSEITVTRASRAVTPAEIEALLATTLAKNYALGSAADISVAFERPLRTVHLDPATTGALRFDQLRFDATSGRFDGALIVAGDSRLRVRMAGTAAITAEAAELSHPLARGEVIKMSDLVLRRVPRSQISSETITDPDRVIGLAARNAIKPGRPLRVSELIKPEIVQRNENVTIVYQVPGLMLAVRGKALEGGAEGDMIDVVNAQSNRTIRGTIVGPGQVAVASISARVLASAEIPSNFNQARARAK